MRLTAALALVLLAPLATAQTPTMPDAPAPSASLTPAEVVRIQVEALRANDSPAPGAGIATVFRFASPGNRQATGPLPRFARMIRAGYPELIGFARSEVGEARVRGDRAVVPVTVVLRDGRRVTYGFALSRQSGGACDGCWLTDAVAERPEPRPDVIRI